jgi:hypothetical protein
VILTDHDREEVQQGGEDAMSLLSLPSHFLSWLFPTLHNASGHRVPAGRRMRRIHPTVKIPMYKRCFQEEKKRRENNCE